MFLAKVSFRCVVCLQEGTICFTSFEPKFGSNLIHGLVYRLQLLRLGLKLLQKSEALPHPVDDIGFACATHETR